MVEHEFFGVDRPSANVLDRNGREAREIRGLSVEEHINRLSQDLIPLAERCARTMRGALAALETLRSVPSPVVGGVERGELRSPAVEFFGGAG